MAETLWALQVKEDCSAIWVHALDRLSLQAEQREVMSAVLLAPLTMVTAEIRVSACFPTWSLNITKAKYVACDTAIQCGTLHVDCIIHQHFGCTF